MLRTWRLIRHEVGSEVDFTNLDIERLPQEVNHQGASAVMVRPALAAADACPQHLPVGGNDSSSTRHA
jgi:hypothetical protein